MSGSNVRIKCPSDQMSGTNVRIKCPSEQMSGGHVCMSVRKNENQRWRRCTSREMCEVSVCLYVCLFAKMKISAEGATRRGKCYYVQKWNIISAEGAAVHLLWLKIDISLVFPFFSRDQKQVKNVWRWSSTPTCRFLGNFEIRRTVSNVFSHKHEIDFFSMFLRYLYCKLKKVSFRNWTKHRFDREKIVIHFVRCTNSSLAFASNLHGCKKATKQFTKLLQSVKFIFWRRNSI